MWEAQWRHLPVNGLAPWIGGQAPTRARTRQGSGHSVLRAQSVPATPRVEIQNEMKLPGEAGQGAASSWRGLARAGLLLLEAATAVLGLEALEKRERLASWTSQTAPIAGGPGGTRGGARGQQSQHRWAARDTGVPSIRLSGTHQSQTSDTFLSQSLVPTAISLDMATGCAALPGLARAGGTERDPDLRHAPAVPACPEPGP